MTDEEFARLAAVKLLPTNTALCACLASSIETLRGPQFRDLREMMALMIEQQKELERRLDIFLGSFGMTPSQERAASKRRRRARQIDVAREEEERQPWEYSPDSAGTRAART
jgi:hypothetical protein